MGTKVIIIGSGIGGLTAGALLIKRGYDVIIFEKEKYIGGRGLSFDGSSISFQEYKNLLTRFNMKIAFSEPDIKTIFDKNMLDGYKLDLGYHAIGGGGTNINAVLSEIDDNADFLESFVGMINNDGYDFPFLSKLDKIKIAPKILRLFFASEKTMKEMDKTSISETIKKYGKGKMKDVLEVFSRSITTMNNLDDISTGEMLRAQKNLYKGSKPVGYPVGGLDNINQKLAAYIRNNDGKIYLEKPIDKIIIKDTKVEGVSSDGKEYKSDIVISNILVQYLFKIIDENIFPKEYVKHVKSLKGTGSLCGYYSLKKLDPNLIGKTYHFIERNTSLYGDDIVGMIDFMPSSKVSELAPSDSFLIQSYVICSPEEAKDKKSLLFLRKILDKYIKILIPNLESDLNWAVYPAIWHLDGVAKTIKKDKPEISTPIKNLFLVGDCVKAPGIGYNCAVNSARILVENMLE